MFDGSRRIKLSAIAVATFATLAAAYALGHRPAAQITPIARAEGTQPTMAPVAAAAKPLEVGGAVPLAPTPTDSTGGVAAAVQTGPVTLAARPDRTRVLSGSDGLVHVELQVRASEDSGQGLPSSPTDMLVVLDVSGSMMGDKLDNAKEALRALIARLRPQDRFSLVTYESEARVAVRFAPATERQRRRFRRVVDGLFLGGGTNMSAGLDLAVRELRHHRSAGRSARVLLLSDGHVNQGDRSLSGLRRRVRAAVQLEDVVSTMGIGDEFNEDLMTDLADVGTGNFYYLSRVEVLGRFFDAELRAASQTVASSVELHFAPAAGVDLVELGSYPIERIGRGDEVAIVRPGNLYAGQQRTLWATLRAPTDALRDVELGTFALHYKHGAEPHVAAAPPLAPLVCVANREAFQGGIVKAVWEEYVATEQYQNVQASLGKAIGGGDARDVDRAQRDYESNRELAQWLGSSRVLGKLEALSDDAKAAKADQSRPAAERKVRAKRKKAKARFSRLADAYNDDPLAGIDL